MSDEARAARRAWIMAHHPDHGGDTDEFIRGLAAFEPPPEPPRPPEPPPGPRVVVVRSGRPSQRVRRVVRRWVTIRRRRTHGRVL